MQASCTQVYNPKMGMDALQVFPCSQAAANQRAGAQPAPSLLRAPVARTLLHLAAWLPRSCPLCRADCLSGFAANCPACSQATPLKAQPVRTRIPGTLQG